MHGRKSQYERDTVSKTSPNFDSSLGRQAQQRAEEGSGCRSPNSGFATPYGCYYQAAISPIVRRASQGAISPPAHCKRSLRSPDKNLGSAAVRVSPRTGNFHSQPECTNLVCTCIQHTYAIERLCKAVPKTEVHADLPVVYALTIQDTHNAMLTPHSNANPPNSKRMHCRGTNPTWRTMHEPRYFQSNVLGSVPWALIHHFVRHKKRLPPPLSGIPGPRTLPPRPTRVRRSRPGSR